MALAAVYREGLDELASIRGARLVLPLVALDEPLEESLDRLAGEQDSAVVAGVLDDIVVGVGVVRHLRALPFDARGGTGEAAIVLGLYVIPGARRHGVATAIVARCDEWGRAVGAGTLHVVTPAGERATRALFEGIGYRGEVVIMGPAPRSDGGDDPA